jgi:hypothetical protein
VTDMSEDKCQHGYKSLSVAAITFLLHNSPSRAFTNLGIHLIALMYSDGHSVSSERIICDLDYATRNYPGLSLVGVSTFLVGRFKGFDVLVSTQWRVADGGAGIHMSVTANILNKQPRKTTWG